jgi:hypothetical protein
LFHFAEKIPRSGNELWLFENSPVCETGHVLLQRKCAKKLPQAVSSERSMSAPRAESGAIIIPFPVRGPVGEHLTVEDRIAACDWEATAILFGYDRMIIHERLPSDPPDVANFLSIYRAGEQWATWCLARRGGSLLAWACATGADIGRFRTIGEALTAILLTPASAAGLSRAGAISPRPSRLPLARAVSP